MRTVFNVSTMLSNHLVSSFFVCFAFTKFRTFFFRIFFYYFCTTHKNIHFSHCFVPDRTDMVFGRFEMVNVIALICDKNLSGLVWSCETQRTNFTHYIYHYSLSRWPSISLVTYFSTTFSLSFFDQQKKSNRKPDKRISLINRICIKRKKNIPNKFLLFLVHNGLMIYRINVIQFFLLQHIKPFFRRRTKHTHTGKCWNSAFEYCAPRVTKLNHNKTHQNYD